MSKARLISFDLDGTLVDFSYSSWVWEEGIPRLYAQKNKLALSKAIGIVIAEYERVGDSSLEWYDINYWFEHFDLPGNGIQLMDEHRSKVRVYPEVKEILEILRQRYELIVISNAAREFIEMEVKETNIERYFTRIFSATSDFKQVKKTPQFYEQICNTIRVPPAEMIHVGDHYEFDFVAPRQLGVEAYFLDRNGSEAKGECTIENLKEFVGLLE